MVAQTMVHLELREAVVHRVRVVRYHLQEQQEVVEHQVKMVRLELAVKTEVVEPLAKMAHLEPPEVVERPDHLEQ